MGICKSHSGINEMIITFVHLIHLLAFYARQHICYSAYMPWQFRLSVCLSVTRVDQSKTVEARIRVVKTAHFF